MAVSIKDVAKVANTSICTVSRALSGKPGVSNLTKRRVLTTVNELGYVPNSSARILREGRSPALTVIYTMHEYGTINLRNFILMPLAKKVFKNIHFQARFNETLDEAVNKAISENCSAIILHQQEDEILKEETVKSLQDRKIALVGLDCEESERFDRVVINRQVGTFQAMRLMLLSGCRNVIVYSRRPLDNPDNRLRGIMKAYKSLGHDLSELKIHLLNPEGPQNYETGYQICKRLLTTERFNGLFCFSDDLAIGTVKALQEEGVTVPDQVKIVGFNNLAVTEYLPVKLTTIELPMTGICEIALNMIKERLADYSAPPKRKEVPTRLIVRESCPVFNHELREKVFMELPE